MAIFTCFELLKKIAAAELIRALNHLAVKVEREQRKGISEDYYVYVGDRTVRCWNVWENFLPYQAPTPVWLLTS